MASNSNSSSSSSSRQALYLRNTDEVKLVFDRFDTNHDGLISASELSAVITSLGSDAPPSEIAQMMDEMDSDKDGFVSLQEFAEFCSQKVEGDESGIKELRDAFEMYDEDANGLISAAELHKVLIQIGETCTVYDCEKMIKTFDADGDGNVDFEEFKKMMRNSSKRGGSS